MKILTLPAAFFILLSVNAQPLTHFKAEQCIHEIFEYDCEMNTQDAFKITDALNIEHPNSTITIQWSDNCTTFTVAVPQYRSHGGPNNTPCLEFNETQYGYWNELRKKLNHEN